MVSLLVFPEQCKIKYRKFRLYKNHQPYDINLNHLLTLSYMNLLRYFRCVNFDVQDFYYVYDIILLLCHIKYLIYISMLFLLNFYSSISLNYITRCFGITQDSETKDFMIVVQYVRNGNFRYYFTAKMD